MTEDKLQWVEIQAIDYAQDCLQLDGIFGENIPVLETVSMRTVEDIDKAAAHIRSIWGLGARLS